MVEEYQKKFTGERAEYFASKKKYTDCIFEEGESPLKHASNVELSGCSFLYKYPLWNTSHISVDNCTFGELGKSGLWYVNDFLMKNTVVNAVKEFRRSSKIRLQNVDFKNAAETLWTCSDISMENVRAKGDYFAMNSTDFYAENLQLDGNYFLDGGKNIEIHNSTLNSKDAFWNCENVTVYDSCINGEYLGWNSKNLRFVNCQIESNQGLCYIENLVLENCTFKNTDLCFEYCTEINAEVKSRIESVKNPGSGKIICDEIGTLILNPSRCNPSETEIICQKIHEKFSKDLNPNEP